jgi:DNA-directed RNA polymerase specialized sigma24 family protein
MMTANDRTGVATRLPRFAPKRPVAIDASKLKRAEALLNSLSERDCDVLRRWYCLEQDPEQIQRETGISEAAFHSLCASVRTRILGSS